jgi:glyoxylase-like metal-dependent hydrolase (beta-lactamase superfamily II)
MNSHVVQAGSLRRIGNPPANLSDHARPEADCQSAADCQAALHRILHVALTVMLAATALSAQQQQNFDKVEIHVLPVQGNIYMLVGAGGNITLQAGKDGVLLVDTMYAPLSDKVYAAIRKISNGPIRYIVNTHMHADHTDGNEKLGKLGSQIAGGNVTGDIRDAGSGASIVAHENVLNRMSAQKPALPFAMLPTDTYFTKTKDIFFNGEAVQLLYQGNAHTDGDSMVFFRRSDVIATGDVFTPNNYPIIDLEHGGSYAGLVASLNKIIEITVPAEKQEGGTYVIPGHGRLCDEADVVEYRDMATILKERIEDMIKKGMTLEQVKAARPTRDYDPLYGSTTGFWTTDKFVEAAYKSLSQTGAKK